MSLDYYIKTNTARTTENLVRKLRKLAKEYSNQYALYYYLYMKGKATFHKLYREYCEITGRKVRLATVRKQLKILEERYKVVKRESSYYIPLLPPEELSQAIDMKRSRAGKREH